MITGQAAAQALMAVFAPEILQKFYEAVWDGLARIKTSCRLFDSNQSNLVWADGKFG
jgi:hypothetical protein